MLAITWVEFVLFSAFAGTLAWTIRFCINNYRGRSGIGQKSAE